MDVKPNQGGIILDSETTSSDVLCGRGTKYCHHDGNKTYHSLVRLNCESYKQAQCKEDKTKISRSIVEYLRNSITPSRFIQKTQTKDGREVWQEVGNKKAWEKTSQLLREMVSKGDHKTVYQKRKWDKERDRRERKSVKKRITDQSPPTYGQDNNLTRSSFLSRGRMSSSLTPHSRVESFIPDPTLIRPKSLSPLSIEHSNRGTPPLFQSINLRHVNDSMAVYAQILKYNNDYIRKGYDASLPPAINQDAPFSNAFSSNRSRYLLDSPGIVPSPHINPYINPHLSMITRNQNIEGISIADFPTNSQGYEYHSDNSSTQKIPNWPGRSDFCISKF